MDNNPYMQVGKIKFFTDQPVFKTTYITTEEKPYCCPICNGNGIVPSGFYTKTGDTWTSSNTTEMCRSCNGKGIVWG